MQNMKQDVFNTILKIAQNVSRTNIPKDTNMDTNIYNLYYDMYLDSLDSIEIIMKLENHYGIQIQDERIRNYENKTIGDFCDLVCSYINAPKKQPVTFIQKIKKRFSQRSK